MPLSDPLSDPRYVGCSASATVATTTTAAATRRRNHCRTTHGTTTLTLTHIRYEHQEASSDRMKIQEAERQADRYRHELEQMRSRLSSVTGDSGEWLGSTLPGFRRLPMSPTGSCPWVDALNTLRNIKFRRLPLSPAVSRFLKPV